MHLMVIICCAVSIWTSASGSEPFGDRCTRYTLGEPKPPLQNAERYCVTNDGFEYCISYNCPPANCKNPQKPTSGICQYCPGTCSYGGRVYNAGDPMECLDGFNYCTCHGDNNISMTEMGTLNPDRQLCFKKSA